MKKKQTKKQPINVQLSKDDLKELLIVLKDFMVEEISGHSRVVLHRMDCHNSRIIKLERIEQYRESKRVLVCPHDDKFDCINYFESTSRFFCLTYKCSRCGREIQKYRAGLSRREKKALRKLGVEI